MHLYNIVAASTLSIMATPAIATEASYGNVYGFQFLANGIVLFQTSGSRGTPPSCSNPGYPRRWAFDATTDGGRIQISAILSAYALQKPIKVVGTGACSVVSDAETMSMINTDGV